MRLSIYDKFLKNECKLEDCSYILKTYDGKDIIPCGRVYVAVKYKHKCVKANIIVIKTNRQAPLMRRDLMKKLGFCIAEIDSLANGGGDSSLQALLEEYSNLFDDKLGKYVDCKIRLKLT